MLAIVPSNTQVRRLRQEAFRVSHGTVRHLRGICARLSKLDGGNVRGLLVRTVSAGVPPWNASSFVFSPWQVKLTTTRYTAKIRARNVAALRLDTGALCVKRAALR